MYNTPSGDNTTALDKFVLRYVDKGYNWTFDNDNIIFTKGNEKKIATAQYNERNYICGYSVA